MRAHPAQAIETITCAGCAYFGRGVWGNVSSLRSRVRNEFPRRWWRSARWWWSGLRELGVNCLAAIATVIFVREATRLVNLRDQPREIARGRVSVEGWTAGLIVGIAGVVTMGSVTGYAFDEGQSALGAACGISAMWSLLNAAVAAIAVGVLVRSRLRQRADWKDLDFIEAHAPRNGRPPETVEEYRVLRMESES